MKILITGITGLLGLQLEQELGDKHEIVGIAGQTISSKINVKNIDITDYSKTYDFITKINPDLVIHSAAMSNVDACEINPEKAYQINAIGSRNIALACQRFDTSMVYISTDYVYSGMDKNVLGYTEFDKTDPISVYGRSKLQGEWFVRHLLNKFFIVRTSWLFGVYRSNFVTQIAESLIAKTEYKAAEDMISAPTYVKDLSNAISSLIETSKYGIYNITNTGFASRYDIAVEIAGMMNKSDKNIKKIFVKALNLPARRPEFSGMRNYMYELEKYTPMRSWQDAVKEFLREQKYM